MADDSATKPKGVKLSSNMEGMIPNHVLPQYRRPDWVAEAHLTVTDSHTAILAAIRRARQLGLKIARKKQSFFERRLHRKLILQGDARNLDEKLSSMGEIVDFDLTISSLLRCPPRLKEVLKRLLLADSAYQDALVDLKTSLLRIEDQFKQTVVEPLKWNLIEGKTPEFAELLERVRDSRMPARDACLEYQQAAELLCEKITKSDAWTEASALNEKIDSLMRSAELKSWKSSEDPKFKELDDLRAFESADGPSSVIAYLEGILKGFEKK